VFRDHANTAPFHLFEKPRGFHRAHEHDNLQRFDVGGGGDHVHDDGDAWTIAVAEFLDQYFCLCTNGPIGDLLTEVVPFPNSSRTILTMSSA
jgi:hypothetical protein